MDSKTAMLYAQLKPYKALVNKTRGFIRWALERVDNPYVACSFGKDSAVMLHLVLLENPDVHTIFVRRIETDYVDNYNEVRDLWIKNFGVKLTELFYRGWAEKNTDGTGIANATKNLDEFDSFFVGLRKDESVGRRISLKTHGMFFKMKNGKTRISPLADWTTNDISTYILTNKLPILNKYLQEGFDARTTAAIPSKYPRESLVSLKERDLTAYMKVLELLPDLKYFT